MQARTLFSQGAIESLAKRRACNFAETRSSLAEKLAGSDSLSANKERFLAENQSVQGSPQASRAQKRSSTVELAPQGEGTHLRLTHAGCYNAESRDQHQRAWPIVLEHLDQETKDA